MLNGGNGNDTLDGGDSNDVLKGGVGADAMDGGAGDNKYLIDNAGDTVADVSGIDSIYRARSHVGRELRSPLCQRANDQAFTFVGSGAFSHTAGELQARALGASTLVSGGLESNTYPLWFFGTSCFRSRSIIFGLN